MARSPKPNVHHKKLFVFHTECIYTRGGEKYLYQILRGLAHSYNVTLYVHSINSYWRLLYEKEHIDVQLLWTPKHLYWILLPITLAVNFARLRHIVSRNDLVYATNFPVNLLAVFLSSKTLCHCFEPLAIFYDTRRIDSLPAFSRFCVIVAKHLYAFLDKYAVRTSTILTTLNSAVTPYILAAYGRKPDAYIPNGIDTVFFSPGPTKQPGVFVIGHSTDYTVFKGTEQFLRGLNKLKQYGQFAALITETINDPVMRNKYKQMSAAMNLDTHVRFVGNLSEKKLVRFYQSIDVYCYTGSPHSAGGATASLSVLEAQACGTPVVRSFGSKHEIVNGQTGYYINPDNPADIAKKLETFMRNPNLRYNMGRRAREYVTGNHRWDIAISRLKKNLSKLTIL